MEFARTFEGAAAVAAAIAAIVAVFGLVVWIRRGSVRQYAELVAETNEALRQLAHGTGLAFFEPAPGDASPFASARGTYRGREVRASVESAKTDDLATSLFVLAPARGLELDLALLRLTADVVRANERGVTLLLASPKATWRFGLLSYDAFPEKDVARLRSALDSTCDVLGSSSVAGN